MHVTRRSRRLHDRTLGAATNGISGGKVGGEAIYRDNGGPQTLALPDAAVAQALRGFVRGRLGQHADVDDLVQETLLRLLGYQTAARVGDVKALCLTIARNLLLDHHRIARRGTPIALSEDVVCPQPTAERILAYRRAVEIVIRAVEVMPPLRREIFLRKRLDGFTTAEIAGSLDMSLAAVEKHVVRALSDLRATLAKRGFTIADGA
jgi:RNA polymerase sigma-70 factor (ECF subfamily)